jgi:hypothetical protein
MGFYQEIRYFAIYLDRRIGRQRYGQKISISQFSRKVTTEYTGSVLIYDQDFLKLNYLIITFYSNLYAYFKIKFNL